MRDVKVRPGCRSSAASTCRAACTWRSSSTSPGVSADPERDLDLALTVLRKRIDEFGVAEPVVQKVGRRSHRRRARGIADPARAKNIVQKSAFLEFRIVDKTGALEKAHPALDRILRSLGVQGGGDAGRGSRTRSASCWAATRARRRDRPSAAPAAARNAGAGGILAGADPARGRRHGDPDAGRLHGFGGGVSRGSTAAQHPAGAARSSRAGIELHWMSQPLSIGVESYRFLYALEDKPIVTGTSLIDARRSSIRSPTGRSSPSSSTAPAAASSATETGRHVGDFMAILLDGRVQGQPPVIQSRIDRKARSRSATGRSRRRRTWRSRSRPARCRSRSRSSRSGRSAPASAPTRSRRGSSPGSSAPCS